jgi:hypothetical protein
VDFRYIFGHLVIGIYFHVLVYCIKENLATLVLSTNNAENAIPRTLFQSALLLQPSAGQSWPSLSDDGPVVVVGLVFVVVDHPHRRVDQLEPI